MAAVADKAPESSTVAVSGLDAISSEALHESIHTLNCQKDIS